MITSTRYASSMFAHYFTGVFNNRTNRPTRWIWGVCLQKGQRRRDVGHERTARLCHLPLSVRHHRTIERLTCACILYSSLCGKERLAMANIYYSYTNNRRGVLRAVLSPEEGRSLLSELPARYAGHQFPTGNDSKEDFAMLRLFDGEDKERSPGFYLFNASLMRIEEAMQHSACQTVQSS